MDELIKMIRRNEVILWAGAGLSSYAGMPSSKDIIDRLIKEVPPELQDLFGKISHSLMDVAEEFQQIQSRKRLINILIELFEIDEKSLALHEHIAQIPQIKKIVTTNYDYLFEKANRNNISVIIDDVHIPTITKPIELFKIHGDFAFPNSIVISKSDYSKMMTADTLLWKEVCSLVGRNSILFIGYSLEDINIKNLFDSISSKLGDLIHNSYLVAPNLPQHKRRWLEKNFSIVYINQTAEEFIPSVLHEVHKYLKVDVEAGFISTEEATNILRNKGLDPEFYSRNGKMIMSSLNLLKPADDTIGEFQFKVKRVDNKLIDLLEGKNFDGIKIPSKDIEELNFSICGIELLAFNNIDSEGSLIIEPLPSKKETADLKLENTNHIIEKVDIESYISEHLLKAIITHNNFDISFEIKKGSKSANLHVNFRLPQSVIIRKNILEFLLEWLKGDTIQAFVNRVGDVGIIPSPDIGSDNNIQIEKLKFISDIYAALYKIQNHFKVTFNVPNEINKIEIDNINILLLYIEGKKIPINNYESTVNVQNIEKLLEFFEGDKVKPIRIVPEGIYIVELFGKKIDLGKAYFEALDAVIENIEDVKQQINRGNQSITFKIVSKKDELYLSFHGKSDQSL